MKNNLQDHLFGVLMVVVTLTSILCDKKSAEEQVNKAKRDASVGAYSYVTAGMSKKEGSHVKSFAALKNLELSGASSEVGFSPFLSANKPMGKTTVEYWPPDMDKQKFYSMKDDSSSDVWPEKEVKVVVKTKKRPKVTAAPEVKKPAAPVAPERKKPAPMAPERKKPAAPVVPEKRVPEFPFEPVIPMGSFPIFPNVPVRPLGKLPDIPVPHSWSPKAPIAINDFETLLGPTEPTVSEDIAVTNTGPIVFPTNAPTVRMPEQSIAYVPRGNSKKRKLKKKVKTAPVVPFVETSPSITPYSSSVSENQYRPEIIPIHEVIDEPMVNIFEPIRYTDVVNNLSNLTEQAFSNNRGGVNGFETPKFIEIIDAPPLTIDIQDGDINPEMKTVLVEQTTGEVSATSQGNDAVIMEPTIVPLSSRVPTGIQDLLPLERMFNQLKRAIDERNIAKIRRIVRLFDESKTEAPTAVMTKVDVTSTEAITTTIKEVPSTTAAPETTTEIMTSETRSRTYLPRGKFAADTTTEQAASTYRSKSYSPRGKFIPETTTELESTMPTTVKGKVYLAPRVRSAQKKAAKAKSSDAQVSDNSITVTETRPSSTARQAFIQSSTEAASAVPLIATSTVTARKNRAHRSHVTPRVRKMVTKSKNTARNISRRISRKPV